MKLIAKLMAAVMILTTVPVQAANYDIHLRWKDGSTYDYYNVPEEITIEQLGARIQQDNPSKSLQDIVIADARPAGTAYKSMESVQGQAARAVNNQTTSVAAPQKDEEWSLGKKLLVGAAAVAGLYFLWQWSAPASGGPCDFSWQTAADGSRCGGRAASIRPGGR
jgi:hypothetical protein